MRPGSSGWPASISAGSLPACMPCRARCCQCPADAVFNRPVRSMPQSRWRVTAGCVGLGWRCGEFRAVIRGAARDDSAVSIQCRKYLMPSIFQLPWSPVAASFLCRCLTTCKWEIKTGRIGVPASARTVPARRTPEASRNDRDSRKSSIHRRHSLVVEAFALKLQCGN